MLSPRVRFKALAAARSRLLPLLLLALAPGAAAQTAPAGAPFAPDSDPARIMGEFETYLVNEMREYTPGMAVVVVAGGETFIRTYGQRKAGEPGDVDEHTVFRLASLSKAFAAATAGVLVQEGALSWDMKAAAYLPTVSLKDPQLQERISLRHILSNSTGLLPQAYTNMVEAGVPFEQILPRFDQVDFVCAPGECYSYQNVVYSFIGEIMKNVTGRDYTALLREKLLAPLRMSDASATLEDYLGGVNHATPHQRGQNRRLLPVQVKQSYYNVAPAAGVNASIRDMEQWLQALLGHRQEVLPNAVLNELFRSHTRVKDRDYYTGAWKNVNSAGYGLGWRIFDYAGTPVAFHGGWVQGFHAEIVVIPSRGLGMAVLMNSDWTGGHSAAPTFLDISLGLGEGTLARNSGE